MSEIRALLLTDVVDSTKLAESIGDEAMAEVWTSHDRVARDLLPKFRGREIDKTDGMLMLFDGAADAVAYALAYHQALAGLPVPLKARAGVHVGAVTLRENSAADIALGAKPIEVEGLAKPTAARVMSLASGGQILLTTEAREDLGKTDLKVVSHGHWIVKGVEEPIELFEAGETGTRFTPPADSEKVFRVVRQADWWMPVRDIPNNLPFQATSFVGRETELDEVKAYLDKVRLLTLLGMGGLGKTRLCLQAAAELMHKFPDGVWFLDLSPLREDAHVAAEAAQILGVKSEPDRTLVQAICAHLKARRALIVLDNCEHLVKPSAELAQAILRAAANVRILATSREALHVPGEQSYPLHPLPLPPRGAAIDDVAQSTAVRLFVARAQQHKPSFALDAAQAASVAELVARLEGIPLALELAAARVRSLSVADINNRLNDRYKILTGGARVLQERQQTLRALVDWSYDLLTPTEQTLLARLGVFVGGFDLEAAEQVCGVDPLPRDDILDLLGSLVDKSLVLLDEQHGTARYRMLETIRDYAREKLAQDGALADAAARHAQHYFALAKRAREGIQGPEQAEWIQRLEADIDNLRATMALGLDGGVDPFIAVKLAVALQTFWMLRGYSSEGRRVVRAALDVEDVASSDLARAWALYVGGCLAESQSDFREAREMLEHCLVLRRGLGTRFDIAAALSTLSLVRLRTGDAVSAAAGEQEALQILREIGNRRGELIALIHLGQVAEVLDDHEAAKNNFEQALAISREIQDQEAEGECELRLGQVAFAGDDLAEAELWFRRSSTLCREAADQRGEANAQRWLGRVEVRTGRLASARTRLAEALGAYRRFEMWDELLGCLEDFAELGHGEGEPSLALRLAAAAHRARERLVLPHTPRDEALQNALVSDYRRATKESPDDAWREGLAWDVEDAVRSALAGKLDSVVQA
jgi:predicted ATPase/class 3 adenylate cyclase